MSNGALNALTVIASWKQRLVACPAKDDAGGAANPRSHSMLLRVEPMLLNSLGREVRAVRIPLMSLAVATLTACQFPAEQPAPDQPGPEMSSPKATSIDSTTTPEYVASLPPDQSRPAVDQLANEVVATESEICRQNPDVDWEACVSTRMLVAFDRYGFLSHHCRDRTSSKDLRDCVLSGRTGVDWLIAAGGNPDTDFDWSQPEQSESRALKALNDALTDKCAGQPEQSGDSCFTRESARLLGLSDAVASRCSGRPALEQRGACIVDAHDTAMYRAALASLNR
jgi:hypothetical protein